MNALDEATRFANDEHSERPNFGREPRCARTFADEADAKPLTSIGTGGMTAHSGAILVTGASGFIGRALVPYLEARGCSILRAPSHSEPSWPGPLDGVRVVIHLAGRAHVLDRSADSAPFFAANTDATVALARAAVRAGAKRLVFASTVKVYGEREARNVLTESDPAVPDDAYAQSKWRAEEALRAIGRETGLEIVIVRLPLVYGPGVQANFARLLGWTARCVPLPLGAIHNRRSLVSVINACDALRICALDERAANKTFLVSDGEDVSTPELLRRTARALSVRTRLTRVPKSVLRVAASALGRRADFERLAGDLAVDSSLIRTTLDWHPPQSLDEGLEAVAAWYRDSAGTPVETNSRASNVAWPAAR